MEEYKINFNLKKIRHYCSTDINDNLIIRFSCDCKYLNHIQIGLENNSDIDIIISISIIIIIIFIII